MLPVVTFLAFRIQHYYNVLLQQAKEAEDDDIDNDDRETAAEKAANMQLEAQLNALASSGAGAVGGGGVARQRLVDELERLRQEKDDLQAGL